MGVGGVGVSDGGEIKFIKEIPLKINRNKKNIEPQIRPQNPRYRLGHSRLSRSRDRPTGEARCARFLLRNPFKSNLNKKTNAFVKSEIPYNL